MLSLSPAKIVVVLVIALVVLGPDKLPGMAHQIGALWGDLRRWRARLETEVRDVFPDLPPAHEISQAVRSPLSFLNRLADDHERTQGGDGPPVAATDDGTGTRAPPVAANGSGAAGTNGTAPTWYRREGAVDESASVPGVPDDPSMN
jgi:sec-independent protein translocase protein TatB